MRSRFTIAPTLLAVLGFNLVSCVPPLRDEREKTVPQAQPTAATPQPAESAAPPPAQIPTPAQPPQYDPLPEATASVVGSWFEDIGPVREGEGFGHLITRIARTHIGTPYFNPKQTAEPEKLDTRVDSFQCVSLVETCLALARCIWTGTPVPECYHRELIATRYRDGHLEGYSSRLHYFYDWISDNAQRERMAVMTEQLGGRSGPRRFKIMTKNPDLYPALKDPLIHAQMTSIENQLNQQGPVWIRREDITHLKEELKEGDIVGIVGNQPGLLIVHTGFITESRDGAKRYIHASSHHERVVLTPEDIEDYVFREKRRRGIVVARPLAP